MIVYGDERRRERPAAILQGLHADLAGGPSGAAADTSRLRDFLIAAGELEQGMLDGRSDDGTGATRLLRSLCVHLGRALYHSNRGDDRAAAEACAGARVLAGGLLEVTLPEEVEVSTPEGYAYYALYPEQYQAGVDDLLDEPGYLWVSAEDPVLIVGVRSIGTSLAGAVAGALEARGRAVDSFTVRPEGHPFGRTLRFSEWQRRIVQRPAGRGWFLVVDEGPGLSGSSLAAVATALMEAGVPAGRIIFMPGHGGGPGQAASEEIRRVWASVHVRPPRPLDLLSLPAIQRLAGDAGVEGLPPALAGPDHSPFARIFHLLRGETGAVLLSYAGLGSTGRRAQRWAERVADAGLLPDRAMLSDGFLIGPWNSKQALQGPNAGALSTLGRLLNLAARQEPQPTPPAERLVEMIYWNTWEALGEEEAGQARALAEAMQREGHGDEKPVSIYCGLLPGDWSLRDKGFYLTRPLGPLSGHTFMGAAGMSWHLAALQFEWGWAEEEMRQLLAAVPPSQRPTPAQRRFGQLSHAAFGAGLAKMCGQGSSTPDYWWRRYEQHKQAIKRCLRD